MENEQKPQDQTPATQDTPTSTPSIDPNILALYNNTLAEKDRQVREALARVEALETKLSAPPQRTKEEESKEFFDNPVELIRREIRAAIAPIQNDIGAFRTESTYAKLKREMRSDPRFKDLDKVEREFDGLMQNQNAEPNTMIAAYYAAYGMVAANDPKRLFAPASSESTTPPASPKVDNVITPPHLRPSAPPAPAPIKTQTNRRELTENERMLMRINGIKSEEEWWALMDARPENVTSTKVEAK